jgi:hypothetical protein
MIYIYVVTIDCQASPATAATSIPPSKTEIGFKYGWSEFVGLDYASSTEGVQPQGIWGEIVTTATAPAYVKEGSAATFGLGRTPKCKCLLVLTSHEDRQGLCPSEGESLSIPDKNRRVFERR